MNTKLFKIGSYFFSIASTVFLTASVIFDKTWINIFSIVFLFLDLICVCLQNRGQKTSGENVDTKRTVIAVVILGAMLVITAVMSALSIFNAGHHV